jgi:hypothetical protein
MTDFIVYISVYISVQQRMQAVIHDTEATDTPRSGPRHVVAPSRIHAVRRYVSIALYRMAGAIQPICEPTSAMANASR